MSDTRYSSPPDYEKSNRPPYEPTVNLDTRLSNKVIKYYMDADRNEPAPTDENGNLFLNFQTVVQGEAKKITLFAYNTISYPMQLEPIIENNEPDLKITRYPQILREGEIAQVDIIFSPSIDRIAPLNSGFDFRKIILNRT